MLASTYEQRLQFNISLYYAYKLLSNLVFLYAIWYSFETSYLSVFTLGIVYAAARFLITILELPTGALADLLGRKKTLSLGMCLEGLSWILLGLWPSAPMILVAYAVNSFGTAFGSGSDSALLFDTLKELKQEENFAKVSSNANLLMRITLMVGAILGGYIYAYHQGLPYILFGISLVLGGGLALLSQEPKIDSEKFTFKNYLLQTKIGLQQLFKSPVVSLFSLFYILNGGITWYYLYFLHTALFTELFPSDTIRGWMIALASLIGGLLILILARIVKADDHRKIVSAFFVITLLVTLPGVLFNRLMLIGAGITLYILGIARFSFLDQVANDYFDSKYRATALSALNMGVSLIFIIWSIAGGWILDWWNTPTLLTILGSFFLITATPVVWKILKLESRL